MILFVPPFNTSIILLLIRAKKEVQFYKLIYIFLQKINWFLKIIKKISSMLKYIQFCIFNIKRYILLYDYEFYYRPESQQSQQKFRKYFDISHNPFFVKKISLLLLRKK